MLRTDQRSVNWGHLTGQLAFCVFAAFIYLLDVQMPILKDAPWWRLDLRIERGFDERGFERAEKSNTEAAYKIYLTAYPDGLHSTEAKTDADDAAFREAGTGTSRAAAYDRYLTDYPQGRHVREANRRAPNFETRRTGIPPVSKQGCRISGLFECTSDWKIH